MSNTTDNNILSHVTGKQTLEETSVDALIEITRQYPAFGAAKFLLAKKTQAENYPNSVKYIQSAVIHFPNSHWFHFKLNEEQLMNSGAPSSAKTIVAEKTVEVIKEEPASPAPLPFDLEKAIASLQYQPSSSGGDIAAGKKAEMEEETPVPAPVIVAEEQKEQPADNILTLENTLAEQAAGPAKVSTADGIETTKEDEQPVKDILILENIPAEQDVETAEVPAEEHELTTANQEQPVEDLLLTTENLPAEQVVEPTGAGGEKVPLLEQTAATPVQPAENLLLPAPATEEHPGNPVALIVDEQNTENTQVIAEEAKEPAEDLQQTVQAEDVQPAETFTEQEEAVMESPPPTNIKEQDEAFAEVSTEGVSTTLEEQIIEEEHPAENVTPATILPEETDEQREADDTDGFEDADAENEAVAPVPGNEKISSVLQQQLEEFKKPVADGAPVPIETEPYHTIDYFASQGIKLSLELQKQDHLAVKVKKFTDWLKQMKRVSPTPVDLGIDEATEHKVQDSAAGSNELREVVTEAMAEVFAMQGMTEKAIQVYIKLSFLDPSKTAYFATKIEKLKGI